MYPDLQHCDGYFMCIQKNDTMYTFQMQCPDGEAYIAEPGFMCGIDWECQPDIKKTKKEEYGGQ